VVMLSIVFIILLIAASAVPSYLITVVRVFWKSGAIKERFHDEGSPGVRYLHQRGGSQPSSHSAKSWLFHRALPVLLLIPAILGKQDT